MVLHTSRATVIAGAVAAALTVSGLAAPATAVPAALPHAASIAGPSSVPVPADDPFYKPPSNYRKTRPGTVLRSRTVTIAVGVFPVPTTAYQLLTRSDDSQGKPIAAMNTVLVPQSAPTDSTRRLLSYSIAIDSLGSACNPSYELRAGTESDLSGVGAALQNGWDVVSTDYEGPEMALFAGPVMGHTVLDGIRAAEAYAPDGLTRSSEVAGWGYSGGGQAVGWAAQLAPTYAPELNVVGWVGGDFATNLPPLIMALDGGTFSGFVLGGAFGIARDYPKLTTLLNSAGRAKSAEMAQECLPDVVGKNAYERLSTYTDKDVYTNRISKPILAVNSLGAAAPNTPTLVQSGKNDEIIPPSQGEYINAKWCSLGAPIQFQQSDVPEHVLNDFATIQNSESWLKDRFNKVPFTSTC